MIARNATEAVVALIGGFGRNVVSVAVKIFSHLIYL